MGERGNGEGPTSRRKAAGGWPSTPYTRRKAASAGPSCTERPVKRYERSSPGPCPTGMAGTSSPGRVSSVQGEPQAHGETRIAVCHELDGPLQVFGADRSANRYRESAAPVSDLYRRPYHLYFPGSLAQKSALRDCCARYLGALLGFGDRTDHPTGTNRPRRFSGSTFVRCMVRRKAQGRSAAEKHTANSPKYGPGVIACGNGIGPVAGTSTLTGPV